MVSQKKKKKIGKKLRKSGKFFGKVGKIGKDFLQNSPWQSDRILYKPRDKTPSLRNNWNKMSHSQQLIHRLPKTDAEHSLSI